MINRQRKEKGSWSLHMERNYYMLVVAIFFAIGIYLARYLQPGWWPLALAPLALLIGIVLYKLSLRLYLSVLLFAVMCGILWAQGPLNPIAPVAGQYEVTGRVYGEAKDRDNGERITFYLSDVTLDGKAQSGRTYCSLYRYGKEPLPQLFDGAQLSFDGYIYIPQGKDGPYGFDYRMWLYTNGISYGISSIKNLCIENMPENALMNDASARVRQRMRGMLTHVMGEDARFAMAMLVNDREGLAQEEREAFQQAGIAHVLSVSGLHVGIVGGLMLWVLDWFKLRRGVQLCILSVFMVGYCILTGFSAASVRAAVMLMLVQLSRVKGRAVDPLIVLSTAMIAVLLINPLQLFTAGFVLSFSAMSGILFLAPRFRLLLRFMGDDVIMQEERASLGLFDERNFIKKIACKAKHWLGKLAAPISLSLAAQLGVIIPTAVYFHQLPLYGILVNMIIIPFVGVLVPLYFLVLLFSWVPGVGTFLGEVARLASIALYEMARMVAELPYASIRIYTPPLCVGVGIMAAAILMSRYIRCSARKRLAMIFLVICITVGGAYFVMPAELRYIQLSAGQADAALLMDGKQTFAIDVGDEGTEVANYLLAEGRDLDALFLTHLHMDHAGGVEDLLKSGIRIHQVYVPVNGHRQQLGEDSLAVWELLKQKNIPVQELAAGDELRYNKVSMQVLWPEREARRGQDANDLPLVLLIDLDGYKLFAAADLTGRYERYAATPCDVLKVAHHGSKDSTFVDFLEFASPRAALITCAAGDQKLPAVDTLERLKANNIPIYRTDETGDIILTVQEGQLYIETYRGGR